MPQIMSLFFIGSLLAMVTADCGIHWHRYKDKCIWFNHHKVSRAENQANCHKMDATMISVHSQEENDFIAQYVDSKLCEWYWLGGIRKAFNSPVIIWDDHSPHDYTAHWHAYTNTSGHDGLFYRSQDKSWFFYPFGVQWCQMCQKPYVSLYEERYVDAGNGLSVVVGLGFTFCFICFVILFGILYKIQKQIGASILLRDEEKIQNNAL